MHGSARASGTAVLVILLFTFTLPDPAHADGGCGAPGRPACTLLRPAARIETPSAGLGAPDCIVQIGGLGSDPDSTARAFEGLTVDGGEVSVLDYESLGQIAAAAEALRDHVARIQGGCGAIHVVAHSLGGVVADRAFSMGLSAADGVVMYIPLASPHNGSALARDLCGVTGVDPDYTGLLRRVAQVVDLPDPTSAAICDLARVRPPRPPRGVETARLRLVTDAVVLQRDHTAPYFDVRELMPLETVEIEGHHGILASAQARDVVRSSIEQRSIASDERSADERVVARVAGRTAERVASAGHEAVADLLWTGAAVARLAKIGREILERVREGIALAGPYLLSYASHLPTVGSARLDR